VTSPLDLEHADPWAADFVDVESLNAHITDWVAHRLSGVRTAASGDEALHSTSLLVLGPAGAGKTHLFARLRRKLGPSAVFVLVRPEIGVSMTPRHVLGHLLAGLQRETSSLAARQLDVVVGSLLARVQGGRITAPLLHLDDYCRAEADERERLIDDLIAHVESLDGGISADYLELLLRVPLMGRAERQAAVAWLSGREPSEAQLRKLGLRDGVPDTEVMAALRTLTATAALGSPLCLVFDQLENLIDGDRANERILGHGTLVSELHDGVRGLTMVQLALDSEWLRAVGPVLSASQRSRVEARIELLDLPTPDERETLVRRWLEALGPEELGPVAGPFPAPLRPELVERWCQASDMTPRALLIACRRALRGEEDLFGVGPESSEAAAPLGDRLEELWLERLDAARSELGRLGEEGGSVAAERVAAALVAVLELDPEVHVATAPFGKALSVEAARGAARATIVVAQQRHPRSLAATLALAASKADDGPVLVVRDQSLPFLPSWHACDEQRAALLSKPGASFAELSSEMLARLIAAHDYLSAARSQDLASSDGYPIGDREARSWLEGRRDDFDIAALVPALGGRAAPAARSDPAEASSEPPLSPPPPRPPLLTSPAVSVGTAVIAENGEQVLALLEGLGIASIERLVHDLRSARPDTSRAEVVEALRAAAQQVRWFGSSIVYYDPARGSGAAP
jgi:hypothetical protein